MEAGFKVAEKRVKGPVFDEVGHVAYPNYIDEMRKKRMKEQRAGNGSRYIRQGKNFQRTLKNKKIGVEEKYKSVMGGVSLLDEQIETKEELVGFISEATKQTDQLEEINSLYIDSIKAKLALLKEIN